MTKRLWVVMATVFVASVVGVGFATGAQQYIITSGDQIKNGVIPAWKLTAQARDSLQGDRGPRGAQGPKGDTGSQGPSGSQGPAGPAGPQGSKGDTGAGTNGTNGAQGPKGDTGATGPAGATGSTGPKGDTGAPASTDYGVAGIRITRGASTAQWATYSTLLGSPVGDTTGGTFRFTCNTSQAPCQITVVAAALSSSNVSVYPRVLVYKGGTPSGAAAPETYCEYGDGSTGTAPMTLSGQASSSTPTYTAVPINIGGSADCGLGGPAGDVAAIIVPEGYYDVFATFAFFVS